MLFLACVTCCAQLAQSAEALPDVNQLLKNAHAGQTVTLPAGMFRTSLRIPDGVSLRGAGYNKTILDVGATPAGISISGGQGAAIEDLKIVTQGTTAVEAENASNLTIRRVLIHGGALGIRLKNVTGGRVENTIIDASMSGVALGGCRDCAVMNCTLYNNSAVGLSIADAEHVAAFNNLLLDAGTGVVLGPKCDRLSIDHNLYVAFFVGKASESLARKMLGPWRDVSGGLDAMSVQLPVQLADPQRDDFRPVSRLDWAPERSTVSGWGIESLDGLSAPNKDIDGHSRSGAQSVGAYDVPPLGGARSDGSFIIADDAGTKSAGIFTPDGRLIHYLFQNLPLKKGTYGYVLPTRQELGAAIEPGKYELRVVESQLRWKDRGVAANSGIAGSNRTTDSQHTQYVCFAPNGSLVLGSGWNERGENIRCIDYHTRQPRWAFPGQSMMNGLCVGEDGHIYCLREAGGDGEYILSKIDANTGLPIAWADGKPQAMVHLKRAHIDGLAELNGTLYAADPAGNRIFFAKLDQPTFSQSHSVPAPSGAVADRAHKLIWVISEKSKVLAIDPSGKIVTQFTGVAKPRGVAVNGNQLAIASGADGKIHFFDCAKPDAPRATKTLGRGDGPFGPILPDRFYFQSHRYNDADYGVVLDFDAKGDLAVRDYYNRTIIFDASGKPQFTTFAQFGNWPVQAFFADDTATRFFDSNGSVSWFIDAKAGTWRPDSYWGYPRGKRLDGVGFFSDSGKRFGIFSHEDNAKHSGVLIVRLENGVGTPVAFYMREQIAFPPGSAQKREMWVVRHDTNHDGFIDEKDAPGTPVLDNTGKPVEWQMAARFLFALPDGSLCSPGGSNDPPGIAHVWQRKGLDADGAPVYVFGPDSLVRVKERVVPSAYNFDKTEDLANQSEAAFAPNGDYLATFQFGNSPNGTGLSNSGGVDLARFARDGQMRWLHPLNDFGPIQGVKPMEKFTLTSWGHQAEWIGLDDNGLGLGHLGFPASVGWAGYWVDHPQHYKMFRGNDGRLHVLVGDYMQNAQHWLSLENYDNYRTATFPVTITPARAQELAFEPAAPYRTLARPPQPRIVVRRLNGPMPIDGKLEKWRAAGITPQIIMTPVTGTGIDSPLDASAVIRLAYEGQNLYVQILRFDDVVTFHQPVSKSHLQDTMEMSLNGFFDGFQFSVSRFTDAGPAIVRRRFFFSKLEDRTPADHAPRVIEVLPDAKNVEERKLIEAIYGIDMSRCKVIVTEFKLPIDKITYRGAEEAIFPVKSKSGFWIGFAIDDNDIPGSDIQKMIVWPATYGTFNVKEDGAWAVFE